MILFFQKRRFKRLRRIQDEESEEEEEREVDDERDAIANELFQGSGEVIFKIRFICDWFNNI